MVWDSNMLLLQFRRWNCCVLNNTEIISKGECRFGNENPQASQHITQGNYFLNSVVHSDKFCTVGRCCNTSLCSTTPHDGGTSNESNQTSYRTTSSNVIRMIRIKNIVVSSSRQKGSGRLGFKSFSESL